MRNIVLILLSLGVLTGVGLGTLYIYQVFQAKEVEAQYQSSLELVEKAKIINTIWTEGDYKNYLSQNKIDCGEWLENKNPKRLNCNPQLIQCFAHKTDLFGSIKVSPKLNLIGSYALNIPHNSYGLKLTKDQYQMDLVLENFCHEMYLPKRLYASEDNSDRKKTWWDNFDRHLFVDRFLVSEFDVVKWLEADKDFLGAKELSKKFTANTMKPALGLRKDEMERFCLFRGKQLLTASIFDGAAMHPRDPDDLKPKYPVRSLWPWSRKKKSGPIHRYQNKEDFDPEQDIKKEDCAQVYSKECLKKFPELEFASGAPTWTGIFEVMGHQLEYLKNELFYKRNLKASSIHFPFISKWHQLGKRAFWDGTYFGPRSFNFRLEDPDKDFKSLKVGFRCYREVYP